MGLALPWRTLDWIFKLKDNAQSGVIGMSGVMGSPGPKGWVDQALKKDIDFDFMRREAMQKAAEAFKEFKEVTKGIDPPMKPWKDFHQDFENINDARAAWGSHPWVQALKKSNISPFFECEFGYFCLDKEDPEVAFIERAYRNAISTHSVLKDGKWYEKGKMGWFGISFNETEDWNDQFDQLLNSIPDDSLISIYDCHI